MQKLVTRILVLTVILSNYALAQQSADNCPDNTKQLLHCTNQPNGVISLVLPFFISEFRVCAISEKQFFLSTVETVSRKKLMEPFQSDSGLFESGKFSVRRDFPNSLYLVWFTKSAAGWSAKYESYDLLGDPRVSELEGEFYCR